MDFSVVKPDLNGKGIAVLPIFDDLKEIGFLKDLSVDAGVKAKIKISKSFKGTVGQVTAITFPKGTNFDYIVLLGMGKKSELNAEKARTAGANLAAKFNAMQFENATLFLHDELCRKNFCYTDICAAIAEGVQSKSYIFNKLVSKKADDHKLYFKSLAFATSDAK